MFAYLAVTGFQATVILNYKADPTTLHLIQLGLKA